MSVAKPPYLELVQFIAAGSTPDGLIAFHPSPSVQKRVSELIESKQEGSLSPEEETELEDFLHLEHILIMAKAEARRNLSVAR